MDTFYERVGGDSFFVDLVHAFYVGVEFNEILRPMYPEDLTESKRFLALFLAQYFGGPQAYNAERGHPRLRMRHEPFRNTKKARDAWLKCMLDGLDTVSDRLSPEDLRDIKDYLVMAAHQLRNA
jgi:hemoglobin